MKLGGKAIREAIENFKWQAYRSGKRIFSADLKINPNSVDVTLHHRFYVCDVPADESSVVAFGRPVNPLNPDAVAWKPIELAEGEAFTINPGQFALAAVRERIACSNPIVVPIHERGLRAVGQTFNADSMECATAMRWATFAPMYEGRSTVGRLGLDSHSTAGFGDFGFAGAFTLELYLKFPRPLMLFAGMRIGQVAFEEVVEPIPYEGAYSGSDHHDGPKQPVLGHDRFY